MAVEVEFLYQRIALFRDDLGHDGIGILLRDAADGEIRIADHLTKILFNLVNVQIEIALVAVPTAIAVHHARPVTTAIAMHPAPNVARTHHAVAGSIAIIPWTHVLSENFIRPKFA
jgi:hypothetical protein